MLFLYPRNMSMDCTCSFSFNFSPICSSLLPIKYSALSFPGFHPRLPLPGLKKDGLIRGFVVCKAFGNDGQEDGNGRGRGGFSTARDKLFMDEEIGAEYGEGFETFRPEGPLKVDVDFLNDKMQENFLQRIRHVIKPDEAFGLIFSWDNVVADTRFLKIDALNRLANEQGEEIPNVRDVYKSMLYAGADHELHKVLHWVNDEAELESLKERLSQLYHDNLLKLEAPVEGLKDWLHAVYTAGVPCAITSSLDRQTLVGALKRMGLEKYFKAMVTEEDDMESIAHRFLSAAVKLDRRPSRCVVFEDDPRGITAAHNCTMMAVALIGSHRAYELGQADLAVGSFDELSVINLRRLFAHKGPRFMDLQKQDTDIVGPPRRKLTIDTIY